MLTCHTPRGGSVITGTVIIRWNNPPRHLPIYTIILDTPLVDGRSMLDAAEHDLLVIPRI
jgi:hypothetical protein